jgi:3D (Asp-Asp-Asp) domain-containing protein
MRLAPASLVAATLLSACGGWGSGTKWVNEPLGEEEPSTSTPPSGGGPNVRRPAQTIGARRGTTPEGAARGGAERGERAGGRTLGTFRNTYYDFPRESDHSGDLVPLMNASCATIAKVPRGFHDAVCVQGSGSLARGGTVSFAKRDCACAEICPRTNQRICFDALDPKAFPFGRGAIGTPIVPLRSVAADTSVLAMGTVIYVPELDGAPRNENGDPHDGCFVVEDRGLRVKGEHVDFFTGHAAQTALLERHVPSNQGVTVVVDAPRCAGLRSR